MGTDLGRIRVADVNAFARRKRIAALQGLAGEKKRLRGAEIDHSILQRMNNSALGIVSTDSHNRHDLKRDLAGISFVEAKPEFKEMRNSA